MRTYIRHIVFAGVICCFVASVGAKEGVGPDASAFRYGPAKGLGYEDGVTRRDPSDVIKVGSRWLRAMASSGD